MISASSVGEDGLLNEDSSTSACHEHRCPGQLRGYKKHFRIHVGSMFEARHGHDIIVRPAVTYGMPCRAIFLSTADNQYSDDAWSAQFDIVQTTECKLLNAALSTTHRERGGAASVLLPGPKLGKHTDGPWRG
jgi:hypothetical protein